MPPKKSKAAAKPGGKSRSPSPTGKKSPKSDVEDKKSAASAKSKKSAASSGKKSPPPKKASPKNEKSDATTKNPKSGASSKSAALARHDSLASTTRVSSPGSASAVEETEEDRVRNQKQLVKKLATKTAQDEWECEDALVRTNWDYEAAKAFIGAKISHSLDSRPRNSPGPEQHGSYDDLPPPPQHASGGTAGGYVPHDPRYAGAHGHNAFVQPGTQSVSPSHPYGGSQPSPPGGPYAPPQQQGSFPQQNSFPQQQGSFPQQQGSFPQQQPQPQGSFPQGNFPQQPPSQPVIAGLPGFPEVGSAAAPITAEQLISAIAQQPWLVPGVLGGMAAHEKQRQQQRSETPSSATTDYDDYTTSPDPDERASRHSNYNKADQQVQFSRNPSNSANRSAFSKPRFEQPHHHQREHQQIHSAEMEVLLEKVRGIEGSLEKVFHEKEELRLQQQQQQEKQAQERRVALPEPPPPPPPLPEAPVYASPVHPAAHLRRDASALREHSRRTMLATQDLRDGAGGGSAGAPPPPPPPAGPPPAHRDSPGGPAKQGADPTRSTQPPHAVLGGLLSSLAGVVPADRDAYGELLSRQQSLLERTRENQEQARVTHLEDELDRMKQKLVLSQKQQLQQLEVLRSIQQEVHEDRRTAEDGLQELEGVSTDINRWAEELYLRQEAHVQAKRDGLLEEARDKQRQLARAAASPGGLGAAADLTDDHRDLVDRTNALARRRAQLARARDPLRQGEMHDELRGIGGRLAQAHGRSGQHEDHLAALAVAMGSTPLPPPSPDRRPPSPPPPPPPILPDPSLQLSPPPQQVLVQQVREENPEVLGELSTLKDVLRLMLHHQLEQSQQQEEVMARQQGLLEKQSLDEAATLNAARQNSAMLQALAQQQRQQQQEAATRERERELTRMESERRSRAAASAALAEATPRGRSSRETAAAGFEREARRGSPRPASRLRGAASPGPATPQQQQRRPRSRSAAKQREQQAAAAPPPPPPQSPGGLARRPRRTDSPMRRFAIEALEVSGAQQGSPRSQALQQSLRGISAAVGQLRDARQTYHAHQSSASPSSFAPSLADGSHPRERDSPRDPPSRRGSQQHLLPQSKSLALPPPTEPRPPQAAAAAPNPLAKILRRFYERHNPTKMDEVDDLIEKFSGRYNTLFHALAKKYNIKASPYRDRLVGFYAKYNPDFLCAVDIILHLVEGSEEKILRYAFVRRTALYPPPPNAISTPQQSSGNWRRNTPKGRSEAEEDARRAPAT